MTTSSSGHDAAAAPPADPPPEPVHTEQAADRDTDTDTAPPAHVPTFQSPISGAEQAAAAMRTHDAPLGRPGRPFSPRSPFRIGMAAAAGVALTVLAAYLVFIAHDMLVLIGLALFIAVGLEPAVSWLARHRLPRWLGVLIVYAGLLGLVGGFLSAAIPQLVTQATAFAVDVPLYLQDLQNRDTTLGRLNAQYDVQGQLTRLLSADGVVNGLLGAGAVVLDALTSTVVVLVLVIYFLADLPRIRRYGYRFVPASRRPRAILLGDEITAKVGRYVLGQAMVALTAGVCAFVWLELLNVPYALLLAIMVALFDVVPVIGTFTAGIICTLVALTFSVPVGLLTAGYFVAYRLLEDYLIFPRIVGRVVHVPGLVTIVALLIGGVLLGVIGAVVAIPVAAAVLLIVQEVVLPRLERA